MAALTIHII